MMNQQITPRQKRPSTAGSSSGQYGQGMVGSSQYAPGGGNAAYGSLGNVSSGAGAGPAPTTKPPTPPQAVRYSSGTLNRSSKVSHTHLEKSREMQINISTPYEYNLYTFESLDFLNA